jgi:hypothetical protein
MAKGTLLDIIEEIEPAPPRARKRERLPNLMSIFTPVIPKEQGSVTGRSDRTEGKHRLLDAYLGMQVGVASQRFADFRLVFHDLTAGDGVAPRGLHWLRGCSPGLFAHHAKCAALRDVECSVFISERAPATFSILRANLARELRNEGWHVGLEPASNGGLLANFTSSSAGASATLLAECSDRPLTPSVANKGEIGFYFFDPNTYADWRNFPAEFLSKDASRYALCLCTMGCNAGGIKRMRPEERLRWYDYLRGVTDSMSEWHDALLIALKGDASQWAYLAIVPSTWRARIAQASVSAFRAVDRDVQIAWLRKSPTETATFHEICDVLFKTRDEREGGE